MSGAGGTRALHCGTVIRGGVLLSFAAEMVLRLLGDRARM
jgi:hypothetical protein